jgi:hypothetical protein
MKNQNDLIFSIVAVVVLLIVFFTCYGTKAVPTPTPTPDKVNLADPQIPTNVMPVMANALPGGGTAGAGGGAGGSRGLMGPGGGSSLMGPGASAASGPQMATMTSASLSGGGGGNTPSAMKPGGR